MRVPAKLLTAAAFAAVLLSPCAGAEPLPRDPEAVRAWLVGQQARHPRLARLVDLGRSHEDRPLLALVIGRGADRWPEPAGRPSVLLVGAHHGGELLTIDFVLDAITELLERGVEDPLVERILDEVLLWCVPVVNPDGVHAFLQGSQRTGRKNGRDNDGDGRPGRGDGVDLNRNYPVGWGSLGERGSRSLPASYWYRGPRPGSEPETQALLRLGDSERFVAALSYHTGTVALLAPYTNHILRSPDPNEAWAVAADIAARMPPHPEGRTFSVRSQLYAVDGTAEDHLRHAYGTVSLLLEGAARSPEAPAARAAVVRAVRPSWRLLLARYLDGPSLHGEIRDAAGRPVAAEVRVGEQRTQEGEVWTSRCRDGRYDRFLPRPGRYTLHVRVAGRSEVVRVVEVSGRARLDIRLPVVLPPRACPAPL